jgi:hypothetical protein
VISLKELTKKFKKWPNFSSKEGAKKRMISQLERSGEIERDLSLKEVKSVEKKE